MAGSSSVAVRLGVPSSFLKHIRRVQDNSHNHDDDLEYDPETAGPSPDEAELVVPWSFMKHIFRVQGGLTTKRHSHPPPPVKEPGEHDLYVPAPAVKELDWEIVGQPFSLMAGHEAQFSGSREQISCSLRAQREARPSCFGPILPTPAVEDCDPSMVVPVPPFSPNKEYDTSEYSNNNDVLEKLEEIRNRNKEFFQIFALSRFCPLIQMHQRARPSRFCDELDFTFKFWDMVNTPLIASLPRSALPHQDYEDFTPEQKRRIRFYPVTSYPSSFWALVMVLIPVHENMLRFFHLNDRNKDLLFDIPDCAVHDAMQELQEAHLELVTKLDSVMIGEWNQKLAYPDVECGTLDMARRLYELKNAQDWLKSQLDQIHALATQRANLIHFARIRGATKAGSARHRQGIPPLSTAVRLRNMMRIEGLTMKILVATTKLCAIHKNFAGIFTGFYNHLADNMCYTPAAGPLFEEETNPIKLNPIYEGFALDPAVENVDWMKSLNSEGPFDYYEGMN
ncbi:hypothetical protein N7528_000862 [Penicillium herquei]|nr:hypothetical protein N7528_000862 [Penicillium herquei]